MTDRTNSPEVHWGEWIGEGWEMFAQQWQTWVLLILALLGATGLPILLFYAAFFAGLAVLTPNTGEPVQPPLFLFLLVPVFVTGIMAVAAYLFGGAQRTALKQLRGEPIAVSDLFSGGDVFWRVLGALLLIGICAAVGAVFCIVPGLIVPGLFFFALPLIVDRKLGVIEALSASFEKTKGNWFMFALFALVVRLLAGAGSVLCGVGMLATYPLLFTIAAVAYRDCFRLKDARSFGPLSAPQAPSYAPLSWSPAPPASPQPESAWSSAPPVETPTSMLCPHCKATLTRTAKFCNYCGQPLNG